MQHDLERVRLGGSGEDVVGRHGLGEREVVGREDRRVEPAALDQLQELGVVFASTRPVVIVTSRIHSVSR